MTRFTFTVLVSFIVVVLLVSMTFFYIELNVHREFEYELFSGDRVTGKVKIDRYSTEGKIILKSRTEFYETLGYLLKETKEILDKKSRLPLEYAEESEGFDAQKRTVMFMRDRDEMDFLFLESPVFFTWNEFRSGDDQIIISMGDLTSFFALFEKYDFWAKGVQFFEVLIPVYAPVPPLRDKAEVRYEKGNVYVNVMGKKVEAEKIVIKTVSLPEIEVLVSKYSHSILSLYVKGTDSGFTLVKSLEGPQEKIQYIVKKILHLIKKLFLKHDGSSSVDNVNEPGSEGGEQKDNYSGMGDNASDGIAGKKMFFQSGEAVFPGRLWVPGGEGQSPGVLIIPDKNPLRAGEKYLLDSIADFLYSSGISVFIFDSAGRYNVQTIGDAVKYLKDHPFVRDQDIILIGYRSGGELVLDAASGNDDVGSCILLGMPSVLGMYEKGPVSKKTLNSIFKREGILKTDDGYMDIVTEQVNDHLKAVKDSRGDGARFYGIRLPVDLYKSMLVSDIYGKIISCGKPVFLISERKNEDIPPELLKSVKYASKNNENIKTDLIKHENDLFGICYDDDGRIRPDADKKILENILAWVLENRQYKADIVTEEIETDVEEDISSTEERKEPILAPGASDL